LGCTHGRGTRAPSRCRRLAELGCRTRLRALLPLLTTAAVLARFGHPPRTNVEAWRIYEAFLSDDRITFQNREPLGVDARWKALTNRGSASPKLWMDAYLAAFAQAGDYQLVTTDAAFAQFDGLDLELLG
jgi:predicted nucleic acid-binding protein